jgi:hypothetical protein
MVIAVVVMPQGGVKNTIQKFAFASSANSTDVADLSQGRYGVAGTTSTTHGYTAGGNYSTGTAYTVTIDKFNISTDANSTDVGDAITAWTYSIGTHV